jgi:hypothetical protein
MKRTSVNPGRVEWSGENPGIYLKTDNKGDYTTLALFFRVVLSRKGRGTAALVLGAPDENKGWPEVPNFILTDNQQMMRWILDGWVTKMPTFKGRAGLSGMSWLGLDSCARRPTDLKKEYTEVLNGSGLQLEMHWRELGEPIPVELNRENSATGKHEMYSVFQEAQQADIVINGTALPGGVSGREFFGRPMSTAFLAFSETWVTPANSGAL